MYQKTNIEYRIMNIECRRNVFYQFYKRLNEAKPPFEILRFAFKPRLGHRSGSFDRDGDIDLRSRIQGVYSTRTTHMAPIPSPLPMVPSPSVVVALILTQPGSMLTAAARFSCMLFR